MVIIVRLSHATHLNPPLTQVWWGRPKPPPGFEGSRQAVAPSPLRGEGPAHCPVLAVVPPEEEGSAPVEDRGSHWAEHGGRVPRE